MGHASPATSDPLCDENGRNLGGPDTYATETPQRAVTNFQKIGTLRSELTRDIGGSCPLIAQPRLLTFRSSCFVLPVPMAQRLIPYSTTYLVYRRKGRMQASEASHWGEHRSTSRGAQSPVPQLAQPRPSPFNVFVGLDRT